MGRYSNKEKARRAEHAVPIKLWIDDVRQPPGPEWVWAKTSADACVALANRVVEIVSFDHDLGGDDTAMVAAKWIEQMAHANLNRPLVWRVHSANPVGKKNLTMTLQSAERFWRHHGHI